MKSHWWFICIILTLLLFLGACAKAESTIPSATPEITHIPATKTPLVPIASSSPTMEAPTLTPTPALISVDIPECVSDGSGGELQFYEALQATSGRMAEWDSYRFSTLYEYLLDKDYSEEDLSVQVQGHYSGLRPKPNEDLVTYPMSSQRYINSHVEYTNLRSSQQSETIITPAGLWYRAPDEAGWMAFEGATGSEVLQLGEWFSPEGIVYRLANDVNFEPGVQAEMMAYEKSETIEGKDVIHRCWVIPSQNEQLDAYLNQGEFIFTLLKNAVVHLWTANDDTELVRLALTGFHTGEYYHEWGFDLHDSPSQFILWLDVDEIDQPITISQPYEYSIVTILPDSVTQKNEISKYPFNDLPLPKDALSVSTSISLTEISDFFGVSQIVPVEFSIDVNSVESNLMSRFLGPIWDQTTSDRSPQYNTQASLPQLSDFYLDEMSHRGWTLAGKFLEAGLPRLFLYFQREQVSLLIILTPLSDSSTNIHAYLPPTDEVLEVVRNNWMFFDETDDPMLGEGVTGIAFDSNGNAWIGTGMGMVMFDGKTWTDFTAKEMGLERPDITAVAVDQTDNVWVGSFTGISRYNDVSWTTFTGDSLGNPFGWVKTIAITPSGEVWAGLSDGKYSVFDGHRWKTYSRNYGGPGTSHDVNAITVDLDGNFWIGTDGGGVFVRKGNEWKTVVKDMLSPDTSSSDVEIRGMAFDQRDWLWITTGGGLRVFDGTIWYDYNEQSGNMPFSFIEEGIVDQYDRVWIASYNYGLTVLEADDRWTIYNPLNPPEEAGLINIVAVDPSGRIWIGSDSGLAIFTTPSADAMIERSPLPTPQPPPPLEPLPEPKPGWTSYALEGEPFGYRINSIAMDQQNRIWLAGWGSVVIKANGEWIQYTLANTPASGLLSSSVNDIAVDKLGRIWMATNDGLSVLDESGEWNNYIPETSDIPCRDINDVEIDSQDHVWAWAEDNSGTSTLSMMISDGSWITYTEDTLTNPDDKPISFYISTVEADHQGRIWIATFDGLTVLSRDGSLKTFTNTELGLTDDWNARVTALFADHEDRMWIGTRGEGVIVLSADGTTVRYGLSKKGFNGGEVSSIVVDGTGRVWIGSDVGLSVLNTDGTWTSYTPENSALPSADITALMIDNFDRIWIGTAEGLAVYIWSTP